MFAHAASPSIATAVEVSPPAVVATPSPAMSPSMAPLLPPVGLPTAPPPDAIKPVEPQAGPDVHVDPTADEGTGRDVPFRYIAVIPGRCERLVVAGRELTAGCADKLVNVDFGNGKVAFVFTTPTANGTVMTTFSGHRSEQGNLRSYRLAVDEITTTTADGRGMAASVALPARGSCAMQGDPVAERAAFSCVAEGGSTRMVAAFRSDGAPAVYAGEYRPRAPVDSAQRYTF